MFTGLFILFIEATTTTSALVTLPPPSPPHSSVDHGQHAGHRPELYASLGTLRIATILFHRPVTLRTTNAESENIATLEVKYRTSRKNFTHRIAYNYKFTQPNSTRVNIFK